MLGIVLMCSIFSQVPEYPTADTYASWLESAKAKQVESQSEADALREVAAKGAIIRGLKKPFEVRTNALGKEYVVFQSREARDEYLASLKADIPDGIKPPNLIEAEKLENGWIGRLESTYSAGRTSFHNRELKVFQVIDDSNVLLVPRITRGRREAGTAATQSDGDFMWVETNTEGMIDGKDFESNKLFEVDGTKQYTNNTGSTTTVVKLKEFTPPKM